MGFGDFVLWPFVFVGGVILLILKIIALAFWIWMIVDCALRKFKNNGEKIVWIILIVIFNVLAAFIYYIVIRVLNPKGVAKK